jgi:hypothetical protein
VAINFSTIVFIDAAFSETIGEKNKCHLFAASAYLSNIFSRVSSCSSCTVRIIDFFASILHGNSRCFLATPSFDIFEVMVVVLDKGRNYVCNSSDSKQRITVALLASCTLSSSVNKCQIELSHYLIVISTFHHACSARSSAVVEYRDRSVM